MQNEGETQEMADTDPQSPLVPDQASAAEGEGVPFGVDGAQ